MRRAGTLLPLLFTGCDHDYGYNGDDHDYDDVHYHHDHDAGTLLKLLFTGFEHHHDDDDYNDDDYDDDDSDQDHHNDHDEFSHLLPPQSVLGQPEKAEPSKFSSDQTFSSL